MRGQSPEWPQRRLQDRQRRLESRAGHGQTSESMECMALRLHRSLCAPGRRTIAAQQRSATPQPVHFGEHTHGFCHRAWDSPLRLDAVRGLFPRRVRRQLELRDREHPDRISIRPLRLHRQAWSKALVGAVADHACLFLDGLHRVDAGTCSLGSVRRPADRRGGGSRPRVASFVMVMWDLCIDPASSTISGAWIWRDGGGYFGVPLVNFLGWYLCVFTIYLLFALYLRRSAKWTRAAHLGERSTWALPAVMYAAVMLPRLIEPLAGGDSVEVTSHDGHVWWTGDIHAAAALVALFTMLFVTVLALVRVSRSPALR